VAPKGAFEAPELIPSGYCDADGAIQTEADAVAHDDPLRQQLRP